MNKPNISEWKLKQILKEHFSLVTALDWHPKTNLLLSCSSDRGIIVWKEDKSQKYMPQLCNIKELKANTDASWSPRGDKFVVGAASGMVFVGTYNDAVGLWIAVSQTDSKSLHDSPVTCVRFDPLAGRVVVSASTDGVVYVTSSYLEDLDGNGAGEGVWGKVVDTEVLFKLKCSEWVNTVSFSPSGSCIAFATHDSIMHFFDITEKNALERSKPSGEKFSYKGAPLLTGCFISEDAYVGSGYDKTPILFQRKNGKWGFEKMLDDGVKTGIDSRVGSNAFSGK